MPSSPIRFGWNSCRAATVPCWALSTTAASSFLSVACRSTGRSTESAARRRRSFSIGGTSHALRVQFHNTRVPFRHVSQLLLLKAGAYQLSGGARAVDFKNARGLQWTVTCAGGTKALLGESERIAGTTSWRRFEVAFTVPEAGECEAQVLRLVLPARIPAEQHASGTVWYDDLRIAQTETRTQ
jgi:hypothetical protein